MKSYDRGTDLSQPRGGSFQAFFVRITNNNFCEGRPTLNAHIPRGNCTPLDPFAGVANLRTTGSAKKINVASSSLAFTNVLLSGCATDIDITTKQAMLFFRPNAHFLSGQTIVSEN